MEGRIVIKAVVVKDERRLLLLGVSEENVRRLRDGKPIAFPGEDVGLDGWDVAIVHGQTEQSLVGELRAHGLEIPSVS